jgi:hypothetical protein
MPLLSDAKVQTARNAVRKRYTNHSTFLSKFFCLEMIESPPKLDQPPLPIETHSVIVSTYISNASTSTVSSPTSAMSADSGIAISPNTRLFVKENNKIVVDMSELEAKVTGLLAQVGKIQDDEKQVAPHEFS